MIMRLVTAGLVFCASASAAILGTSASEALEGRDFATDPSGFTIGTIDVCATAGDSSAACFGSSASADYGRLEVFAGGSGRGQASAYFDDALLFRAMSATPIHVQVSYVYEFGGDHGAEWSHGEESFAFDTQRGSVPLQGEMRAWGEVIWLTALALISYSDSGGGVLRIESIEVRDAFGDLPPIFASSVSGHSYPIANEVLGEIPEPGTVALSLAGLLFLARARWMKGRGVTSSCRRSATP
jgi:hypothetical protein